MGLSNQIHFLALRNDVTEVWDNGECFVLIFILRVQSTLRDGKKKGEGRGTEGRESGKEGLFVPARDSQVIHSILEERKKKGGKEETREKFAFKHGPSL